jgi:hypothetical protein
VLVWGGLALGDGRVVVDIAILSIQPILNMLSTRQVMNASFNPLNLVNTYGAFGAVSRERLSVGNQERG